MTGPLHNIITIERFPVQRYRDKNGPRAVNNVVFNAAVANDQQIIAAVSGLKILVIGGCAYSNGAATALNFKSNAGGTPIRAVYIPVNTVAQPTVPLFYPGIEDSMESVVGQGIFVDNSAVIAVISLTYIFYAP